MTKLPAGSTPATHTAPETLVSGAEEGDRQERKPIETVEALGKVFVAWLKKNPLPKGASERIRIGLNDEAWRDQPITLWNSWHRDKGTKWNFNVFEGRLVEAVSDAAMAGTASRPAKSAA